MIYTFLSLKSALFEEFCSSAFWGNAKLNETSEHTVELSTYRKKLFPYQNCGRCYSGNKILIFSLVSEKNGNVDWEFASCTEGRDEMQEKVKMESKSCEQETVIYK
jgi:hypothetical protein